MLNRILFIVVIILCVFIVIVGYIFIKRKNNILKKNLTPTPSVQYSQKIIVFTNNSNIDLLIDKNKLNQYYLKFSESPTGSAGIADPFLTNADSIEIIITFEKQEKKDIFFSMPPDSNNANITYSRINADDKIQLIAYLDERVLEKRTPTEIKKIIELQTLEVLYFLLHPEINNSPTLVQDMLLPITLYQSGIGPLFD